MDWLTFESTIRKSGFGKLRKSALFGDAHGLRRPADNGSVETPVTVRRRVLSGGGAVAVGDGFRTPNSALFYSR